MILAFQCREFGFGMEISIYQPKRINEKRRVDREYFDKLSEKAVLETTKKSDLP